MKDRFAGTTWAKDMNVRKWMRALATALSFCAVDSLASPLLSGSISGVFTDPVLSGFNSDLGVLVPVVNKLPPDGFADYTGFGSNSILWGNGDITDVVRNGLIFTGAHFSHVSPDQPFYLGTITYANGNAYVDTTIFGATLTLTVTATDDATGMDVSLSLSPVTDQMGVIATLNYDGADPRANADVLTFQAFSQTFNVFEGQTAIANVFGMIVGDPMLTLANIELAPDQKGNGFIGNGVFVAPEPATLGLLLYGLAGLGFRSNRRVRIAHAVKGRWCAVHTTSLGAARELVPFFFNL